MDACEKLIEQYAAQDRLGEEFFLNRLSALREGIVEREFQMKLRDEVSRRVLSQIEEEASEAAHRLKLLPMTYASERIALRKSVESLQREKRQEIVRATRDMSDFARELQEKKEEYEGMKQLFGALTITKKSQSDRDGGLDVRA